MAVTAQAPSPASTEANRAPPELAKLRSAVAVRERCEMVRRFVADGRSAHFTLDEGRLPAVAAYVAEVTRADYPDLKIPYHSRWRHFSVGGVDRWAALAAQIDADPIERARIAMDLATVSVLLDAGAGDAWRYREGDQLYGRSEGLAVASLAMFRDGLFSSDARQPLRADSTALARVDAATLARYFQVDTNNPLVGVEGRSALLNRLGRALGERPELFGRALARPGHLVDHFLRRDKQRVAAAAVLAALLDGLSSIWPSGLMVDSFAVGDAGRHPAVRTGDMTDGIVPFHKLSQWLTYSLIEPLETAGLEVERLNELTALPEYRNGGLLIDLGVIRPRTPIDPRVRHAVSSELIVEWRALTVALMDRLVDPVRRELGLDATFAMPHMLQGGTWTAGRKIALELRPPDGPSPIPIAADGTVF
jgi:uncharacterized protein DUF1688